MSFAVFGALSLCWLIFSAIYVWGYYKNTADGKRMSALSLFTVCVFVSLWLMLLPANYAVFDTDGARPVTAVIMTLLNTLQVFINEGSTDTFNLLSEYAAQYIPAFYIPYTLYAAVIITAAPILALGNVLLLFREFTEELRFAFSGRKNVYIMSELNNRSVTLAKSIMKQDKPDRKLVVFTYADDENESELIFAAKKMNAVILKKDVTELDLTRLKKTAELFMIGDDENENVTKALAVTKELNERRSEQNIKIFAFAHSRASGCIIDSAKYDNLLNRERLLSDGVEIGNIKYTPPKFRLRRVDVVSQFVRSQAAKMGFFDCYDKDISILIAGLGTYGLEFFRTLSWFCQLSGRRLEINIIDKNPDIRSAVNRHCPGLLMLDGINPDYSVEFFSDTDLDTDRFTKLLGESSERSARLKRTTHAIIALGSDEADTEAAIYLRELFERAASSERDKPKIYAVLYDDCLCSEDLPQNRTLINHKGASYGINFIGGLSAKYSRQVVCNDALEMYAFKEHIGWVIKNLSEDGSADESYRNEYIDALIDYERFEYYRLSSISKAMYEDSLNAYLNTAGSDEEREEKLKKNEHDRWALYMCANGYVYDEKRNDIAKTHYDIVHFDALSESEKRKDEYIKNK